VLTMDPEQLLSIRNFGPRALTELRERLAEFGYLPEGEFAAYTPTERTDYLDELETAAGSVPDGAETMDVAGALASMRAGESAARDDEAESA
ncbi:MAG: hypothetical protein M3R06_09015, partial [Chloroflexota bacterium]|nr:hypothetical protein [Chloroflexota bacterium]